MNDVLNTILDVEKECSNKIAAGKEEHDRTIAELLLRIEARRKEEKKRIADENSELRKREVEAAGKEIVQELSFMKKSLSGLVENKELCDEVRQKIISIIFK